MKFSSIYPFFFLLFTVVSCEIINPAEKIPAYIAIDKISLESDGTFGTSSAMITEAWVNIDGNPIGTFELPVTFPVLDIGKHSILIRAGIKPNGIAAKRKIYPFFTRYQVDTVLTPDETMKLVPKVSYVPETKILLNETFENSGFLFDTVAGSDVALVKVSGDRAFEGDNSGAVIVPAGKKIFKCKSSGSFSIPSNSQPVYLEMDYKNNMEFVIGIYVNISDKSELYQSFYHVNPSGTWNKVYVELTDMVYANLTYSSFNIFIGFEKKDQAGDATAEIYIDNLKLLNF